MPVFYTVYLSTKTGKKMDEKQLQAPATELAKNLKTPEDLSQFSFFLKKLTVETLIKSWIAKGFNLVMERSHLEDYIFINFMLKTGYINESHHRAYMQLWEEINHIIPVPDLIVFLNYSAEHSLNEFSDIIINKINMLRR
ncbi:deoxynucleoside kinase [Xenorhabdus stockiae]|uniref:deoxynucleoside kinase n=1 Tax=Xenorhabdus stockiae TaxID=351614 RepID=UPI003CEFE150